MTLKENITQKLLDLPLVSAPTKKEISDYENGISNLKQIADDYAIEFAEWLRVNYYDNGESWTEWNSNDNTYSSKELLEIFKKEKGL